MSENGPQSHAHKPAWSGTDWRRAMAMAHRSKRCTARCKHTKQPCKGPAVKGRSVCRMHGGKAGAPRGERNGNYRHGRSTIEYRERERRARAEYREFRALLKELGEP